MLYICNIDWKEQAVLSSKIHFKGIVIQKKISLATYKC